MLNKLLTVFTYVTLITLMSFSMMMTESPIILGIYIFLQTFFLSLLISSISYTTWTSYILFIVSLGGVLIVFLYVIMTLTVGVNPGKSFPIFLIVIPFIPLLPTDDFSTSPETFTMEEFDELEIQENFLLSKITSVPLLKFSVLLMMILFLVMVVIVYITRKKSGSLSKI